MAGIADLNTILSTIQESNATCHVSAKLKAGGDYVRWKREITLYLRGAGLWSLVSVAVPANTQDDQVWVRRNDKALSAIHNACVPQQQDLIMDFDHAKEAWDKLRSEHESTDSTRVQILWHAFQSITKASSESIADYMGRIKSSSRQLTAAKESVSESQLVNRIVEGLPVEFNSIKSSLAVVDDLTEECLLKVLLRKEARLFL